MCFIINKFREIRLILFLNFRTLFLSKLLIIQTFKSLLNIHNRVSYKTLILNLCFKKFKIQILIGLIIIFIHQSFHLLPLLKKIFRFQRIRSRNISQELDLFLIYALHKLREFLLNRDLLFSIFALIFLSGNLLIFQFLQNNFCSFIQSNLLSGLVFEGIQVDFSAVDVIFTDFKMCLW